MLSLRLLVIVLSAQGRPVIGWSTTRPAPSLRNAESGASSHQIATRRDWLRSTAGTVGGGILILSPCTTANAAIEEFPSFVKPITKLAPLGPPRSFSNKSYNLPLNELAAQLSNDLVLGSTNRGGYFLTGDLSPDLFRDDCTFIDPTNSVSSLSQYQNALRVLFDAEQSEIEIIKPLAVEAPRTIKGTIRSRGVLKFPWHPQISSYESEITYRVGEDDGLIYEQSQQWSKSTSQALRESFTPSLFSPAPKGTLPTPSDEPKEVTQLYGYINGRRPNEFSDRERLEIERLISKIVDKRYPWKRELLQGKWMLAYLQPGRDGRGIDRRIPFPELPFNANYQIFGPDTVTNVGELLGPLVEVRVSGDLEEKNASSLETPKRFVAHISDGRLCWREATCLPLPISGEGLFDGVFLGDRLRIGQNLNGGGARVVQVRLA